MTPPRNTILTADCLDILPQWPDGGVHLAIADPPYFRVLEKESWDNQWPDEASYLDWSLRWMREVMRCLVPGGLLFCFGQPGKREHIFLHLMSRATGEFAFHDLIIWDRAVGYNERRDSFTPAYEMILVLRKEGAPARFDKDAVREPYDAATQALYARDKRYKDADARQEHLKKGKFATNVWRIPSLKGTSREKMGHPSQKPAALIERIVRAASAPGDLVLDPFLGSGTTALVCQQTGRDWIGIEISPDYAALAQKRLLTAN